MTVMFQVFQVGDLVHIKNGNGNRICQPSERAKGKFGKIMRRYVSSTRTLPTVWWIGFELGTHEPIAEDWLVLELNA